MALGELADWVSATVETLGPPRTPEPRGGLVAHAEMAAGITATEPSQGSRAPGHSAHRDLTLVDMPAKARSNG